MKNETFKCSNSQCGAEFVTRNPSEHKRFCRKCGSEANGTYVVDLSGPAHKAELRAERDQLLADRNRLAERVNELEADRDEYIRLHSIEADRALRFERKLVKITNVIGK